MKNPKTRNHGTMTEPAFLAMIRSALRRRTMYWIPVREAKLRARREYAGSNKRQKWEYQCDICKDWVMDKDLHIDHIKPVGQLKSLDDFPEFIDNLFCEVDNLRCLCKPCHKQLTKEQRHAKD